MPMPKPGKDENQDDFMARCMSHEGMMEEFEDNKQRLAVCFSQWRAVHKPKGEGGDMERKAIRVALKAGEEGTFLARIATLNVLDKDRDVTLPGAFPLNKAVLVSAYQHGSWSGQLPVGKAIIREAGEEVLADGQFFLTTQEGKEHYETIKAAGDLVEWSYGFQATAWEKGKWEGQEARILKAVAPFEISPVLRGAGVNTATLAIKSQEGESYITQAETVLAAVSDLEVRTRSLADLRRKEGRDLSPAHRDRVGRLLMDLGEVATNLKELLDATDPDAPKAALKAYLEYSRIKARLTEVMN